MQTLEVARSWISNGFSIIPIEWRSKRPAFGALKQGGAVDDGGRPVWETFKGRQACDRELWLWFAGPRRNLGVVTGYNGLVVLDFDVRDAYDAWSSWARAEGGLAARVARETYRVYSARGVHVYVVVEEPVTSYQVPGIDVKGAWGYVLAPPSIHPCGHEYVATGSVIARCGRLAEVFPFERPAVHMLAPRSGEAMLADPWDTASRAVECGGEGAVSTAKGRLAVTDLVTVTSRDRGGAWAICPLHRDTNPSLRVYADGHYYCFGCQAHGDVIDMYAALHRMTNREAIAALAERV